jgi:CDP-diacylglycerol--glycerol-3-phosphate 3-phosphatidyltransferase
LSKEASKDRIEVMRREFARYFTVPVVSVLAKTGATPDGLTWFGFILTIGAAALAGCGYLFWAGLTSLFAAFFDMLDGALARKLNKVTLFGGILDSTLDRLSEGAMLIGILIWYLRFSAPGEDLILMALLVGITIVASFTVSYIRARSEGAGLKGEVGISTRPERVILTAIGLLIGQVTAALAIIAVMSTITVIQRLHYAWKQAKGK